MVLFQYGVALHELESEHIRTGEITIADKRDILRAGTFCEEFDTNWGIELPLMKTTLNIRKE